MAAPDTALALAKLGQFLDVKHPGWSGDRRLHDEARALSLSYTEGKAFSVDAAASVAYLAYFGARAIVAAGYALDAAHVAGVQRAVDVGAGSGASALALAVRGARSITLVEQSLPAQKTAKALLAHAAPGVVVSTAALAPSTERAELVLASFLFSELDGTPREAFARVEATAKGATVVLVDAGDHARARRVQELRDALCAEGRAIVAPCPHQGPCPALVRARDWCHVRVDKALPKPFAAFAQGVGRDERAMALSHLVVAPPGTTAPDAAGIVVVGEVQKDKGRARLPVCGPDGVRFVQALKRHKAAYQQLLATPRGVRLDAALASIDTSRTPDTLHVEAPIPVPQHGAGATAEHDA